MCVLVSGKIPGIDGLQQLLSHSNDLSCQHWSRIFNEYLFSWYLYLRVCREVCPIQHLQRQWSLYPSFLSSSSSWLLEVFTKKRQKTIYEIFLSIFRDDVIFHMKGLNFKSSLEGALVQSLYISLVPKPVLKDSSRWFFTQNVLDFNDNDSNV